MTALPPVVVVSRFLPDPAGPASARLLHGFATGARQLGRDVRVLSWWPRAASGDVPPWVDWRPLPKESWWRMKARALVRPRSDAVAQHWDLPAEAVVIAEEPLSFPVVRRHPRSVLNVHYSPALDRQALPGRSGLSRHWQDIRAERQAARVAVIRTSYSGRVATALPAPTAVVPCAIDWPGSTVPLVDAPIAACVADWSWPPNARALHSLLAAWPAVRARLPAARLLLAGADPVPGPGPGPGAGAGSVEGVELLGPVERSTDVLARAAVLAFPCPATSGPKVKVLEAAALGLPVVTTAAGVEGLDLDDSCFARIDDPADPRVVAAALVAALGDPQRRAATAAAARARVERSHAPRVAAAARLAATEERLP